MKQKENTISNKSQDCMANRYCRYRNRVLRGYLINKKAESRKDKRKNTFVFDSINFHNNFTGNFDFFQKKNTSNEVHDFIREAISPIKSLNSPLKTSRENDENKSIQNISIYKLANDSNEGEKEDADSLMSINQYDLLSQKNFNNTSSKRPSKNSNGINHTSISLNLNNNNNTDSSNYSNRSKKLLGFKNATTIINSNNNSSKDKEEFTFDKIVNETFNCIDPLNTGKKAITNKIRINKKLETAFGRNFFTLKSPNDCYYKEEKVNNIEENFDEYVAYENSDAYVEDDIIKNDLIKNLELDIDEKIIEVGKNYEKNNTLAKEENVDEDKLNSEDKVKNLAFENEKKVVSDTYMSELHDFNKGNLVCYYPNTNQNFVEKSVSDEPNKAEYTQLSMPNEIKTSNFINWSNNLHYPNPHNNSYFFKSSIMNDINSPYNKNMFPNINYFQYNNNNNFQAKQFNNNIPYRNNNNKNVQYNINKNNYYFCNFYQPNTAVPGMENHNFKVPNYNYNDDRNNRIASNFIIKSNLFTNKKQEADETNKQNDFGIQSFNKIEASFYQLKNNNFVKGFHQNSNHKNINPNTIINFNNNSFKEKTNKNKSKFNKRDIDYNKIDNFFKAFTAEPNLDYIFTVLKEQKVCRYFQKKIEDNQNDQFLLKSLFKLFLKDDRIFNIILDQFGNYVLQKFLEILFEDKESMMLLFSRLSDNLFFFSINHYGTRVIQKALDLMRNSFHKIDDPKITSLINDLISINILNLIKDSNGNHVFTKVLVMYTYLSNQEQGLIKNQFIYNEIVKNVIEISKLKQGGNVMQKTIECANQEQKVK